MNIREVSNKDWDKIWPIFHEVVASGETYAYEVDTNKEKAKNFYF